VRSVDKFMFPMAGWMGEGLDVLNTDDNASSSLGLSLSLPSP